MSIHEMSGSLSGLEQYNDISLVRKTLRSGRFTPTELCDGLWAAMLEAFPCPKKDSFPAKLPKGKKALWDEHAASLGNVSGDVSADVSADVSSGLSEDIRAGFVRRYCVTKNICASCACKNELISFFERTEDESRDTIRHRVTSWLSGKVRRLDRTTCIKLCFAMNMRIYTPDCPCPDSRLLTDAERFLEVICRQPPLYPLIPEEAVYYFCLANPGGRDSAENWLYALDLAERCRSLPRREHEDDMHTMLAASYIESIHDEDALFDFIAGCGRERGELYATAKENCRLFFEQHELSEDIAASLDEKPRTVTKKQACRVIDSLERFDLTGELPEDTVKALGTYSLSELLAASDRLSDIVSGDAAPDRTVMLLAVLALNYGARYDPESNALWDSDELTEQPSFRSYYESLSVLLKCMGLAPLYPGSRIDFLVLYSYHLLRRDIADGRPADALSAYIARALVSVSGV